MNNKVKNWWSTIKAAFAAATVGNVASGINRFVFKMVVAGLVINIIASSFYPELPNRFPIVYGLFDGCLQFAEFLYRLVFRLLYLILTLKLVEIPSELGAATAQFWALLNQLSSWLASIHF